MLVVDRRMDETAYGLGANRAEVQAELDKATLWIGTQAVLPAQVEVDEAPSKLAGYEIFCITSTPGPSTLLQLLLRRVWGIEYAVA